jgi:hypothetical protein
MPGLVKHLLLALAPEGWLQWGAWHVAAMGL